MMIPLIVIMVDQEPWELVTPVLNLENGERYLKYIFRWFDEIGATTNATTGLHFNLSNYNIMPKFDNNLNRLKLVRLINKNNYLKMLVRQKNQYVRHMI